jgi:hypothetical protein
MSEFLTRFDGVQSRTVFCFWTGSEAMSNNRIQALWTIFNNSCCSTSYDSYNNRYVGFLAERFLSFWIDKNKLRYFEVPLLMIN